MTLRNRSVRADRIAADIDALAAATEPDHPFTRRAFTPVFARGREIVAAAMRRAGLDARLDTAGNLIGRREGSLGAAPAIVVGSHSDTVPDGGRFDGIAGVVAGLEVARALAERGVTLRHPLEIHDCLAEEVSIFGVSCIGSRAAAGVLPPDWLARRAGDLDLAAAIRATGGDPDRLGAAKRTDLAAFLELHIEQGPVLEAEGVDVGIVTAIAGITRIEVVVEGRAGHAGTTPMDRRADALAAAARLVLDVRAVAMEIAAAGLGHFTATVGELSVEPNAANVVPSRARLLIDARAEDPRTMALFRERLDAAAAAAAEAPVRIAPPRLLSDNPATPSDPGLLDLLESSCDAIGLSRRRMVSGAGHDMAFFARVAPAAMIFVPCREGRSHCPEEWADVEAIALGAEVLLETILRIDAAPTAER